MTEQQQAVQAMILVRCERCSRRLGTGTRLGEMLLFPEELGGRWGWLPWARSRDRESGSGRRPTRRKSVDVQFSGAAEIECRRCHAAPRVGLRVLAGRAADTHAAGLTEFVV